MISTQELAHRFLLEHGMHPDLLDMSTELAKLRQNMEHGLSGNARPDGCQMLPAFITPNLKPPLGEKVLALDAGGTNLRAALVSFTDDGPLIEDLCTCPLPRLASPVDKKEFLREIALFSAPLAEQSSRLGFCFSYPAEIMPDGDGKVICFTKEICVTGSTGMLVCRELLDMFSELGIRAPTSFALLNDTVAVMLGGCVASSHPSDGMLGLILGTGSNVCYLANTENIRRPIYGWSSPKMVVNMESGTYNGFPQGDFDLELDRASMSPGTFGNEKMVGGVYQGEVLLRTLRGASQTLFSPDAAARISAVQQLTAADLSAFLESTGKSGILSQLCATEDDRNVMKVLVTALLERAAKLVTLILAGPMEAENMGKTAPALVVAEGSTFWKNHTLRRMIETQANAFLSGRLGRSFTFFGGNHLNLYGAALASYRQ